MKFVITAESEKDAKEKVEDDDYIISEIRDVCMRVIDVWEE